jgi:predicted metallopeptidase
MTKKKTIDRYLDEWIYRLGLRWWNVVVYWHRKPKMVKRIFGKHVHKTVLAQTYADWRYGIASIHINLPAFQNMSHKETECAIVHELCHILVNELREGEIHHEERVVTGLQKAFLWTREGIKP